MTMDIISRRGILGVFAATSVAATPVMANAFGFLRGNAIKYLARCDDKGGLEDLKKARHYLDKLIECHEHDT